MDGAALLLGSGRAQLRHSPEALSVRGAGQEPEDLVLGAFWRMAAAARHEGQYGCVYIYVYRYTHIMR